MNVNLKVLSAAPSDQTSLCPHQHCAGFPSFCIPTLTVFVAVIIQLEEEGASYCGFDLNVHLLMMLDAILLTI